MKPLDRLTRHYKALALILLNGVVLLIVLNITLLAIFGLKSLLSSDRKSNPVSERYANIFLSSLYPQLNPDEINDLLIETWSEQSMSFQYEPFTLFKERPRQGVYINISENGFRISKNQGPWPPSATNFNVFLFGGSTTFGYGVPDKETIASNLQEILSRELGTSIRVYNFGRGFYYSTHERILFEQLLLSGFVPDMAIFIDGFNEFYFYDEREPAFTQKFRNALEGQAGNRGFETDFLNRIPMIRLAKSIRKALNENDRDSALSTSSEKRFGKDLRNDQTMVAGVVDRYLRNMRQIEAVAADYGAVPIFVWQPVPTYRYDSTYHPYLILGAHNNPKYGYPYFKRLLKDNPLQENFLWCANIQTHFQEALYVDSIHYSPRMSRIFAYAISSMLLKRDLLEINSSGSSRK